MVEQDGSLGNPQRVVIADADHAGTKLDVASSLRRDRDEDLGRRDDLGSSRVVLADPRLVPAEAIQMLDQLEISLERQRRVLPRRMKWCHEDTEPQTVRHRTPLSGLLGAESASIEQPNGRLERERRLHTPRFASAHRASAPLSVRASIR